MNKCSGYKAYSLSLYKFSSKSNRFTNKQKQRNKILKNSNVKLVMFLFNQSAHRLFVVTLQLGSMIISLLMNINLGHLGGASILRMFTTTRPHGSVNTTTWLGISQFFLFLAPNFNILTTENRSICNRDLN